jgi:hypothetical protein
VTEPAGILLPDWELPAGVRAFVTTRENGASTRPWDSFNLAQHVGDDLDRVAENRALLQARLARLVSVPALPVQWVQQVHGSKVLRANLPLREPPPRADAIHTTSAALAIGVLTADCLPVLFCADDGSEIAVAHAGWRGLLGGVLEATLACFGTAPAAIRAWLGPAIGPCHFEVGAEVRSAFLAQAFPADALATADAFATADEPGKWFADLYALARIRLRRAGVCAISGQPVCTSCDTARFYSYRQHAVTGRFATLILRTG